MRAVLFPGQGSQFVGMAKDFYDKYEEVKKAFSLADDALGFSISKLILNGPESELKLTKNTQPAILLTGVSIFRVLNKFYNLELNSSKFFSGHSLGEYTALVCSGSISLENAVLLSFERGKAMQNAVPINEGGMIAILGMSMNEVEEETALVSAKETCEVANDNCEGQIVVSGTKNAINLLYENLKKRKKKGIILPVSAPFHCSLMKKASNLMEEKINKINFLKPNPPIISNVTAKEENDPDNIKKLLIKQITGRVRWRESMDYMIKSGVSEFLEIGPGKVLSGLVKKINKSVKIKNINFLKDLDL